MRIVRWLAIPAMIIIGAGAVWISTSDSVGRSSPPAAALTSTAEVTNISQEVAATGNVQPAAQYALAFGSDAVVGTGTTTPVASTSRTWTVTDVLVALGDRVTKGQVLATADTADVQADIDALRVQIADAQQTLSDATTTRADARTTTRQQLDSAIDDLEIARLNHTSAKVAYADSATGSPRRQARVQLIQAKAQVDSANQSVDDLQTKLSSGFPDETQAVADAQSSLTDLQAQLADLDQQQGLATLRAPVDGVVSEVDIMKGYAAPSGTALVVDSDTLQVVASVVESDLAAIALGQDATVTLSALDLDATGTVTAIAPSTASSSSSVVTYPVTVTLTDADERIRSGMSTDVTISTAVADNVVAVPVAALHGASGSYTVNVVGSDGTIQPVPVTVGLVTETLAEVRSGVTAGQKVVIGTNSSRTSTSTGTGQQGGGFGGGSFLGGGGGFPGGGGGFPPSGR